jgi:hypothetical protein
VAQQLQHSRVTHVALNAVSDSLSDVIMPVSYGAARLSEGIAFYLIA